jgi:hypothetical protein
VDVQEVRWDKGGTGRALDYISYKKEMKIIIANRIFIHIKLYQQLSE